MSLNVAFNTNRLLVFPDESIFSVSELSAAIKGTVESNYSSLKLRGEVSGVKTHSSGHTYLSLKDDDAIINAICWRGTKINFQLEDGMEIVVRGRVTVYPARSQYQFIIEEASMAGEGALLKLLNDRKKRFSEMGYFNKKNPIPKFPRIIGIITSKTGAVLQDMRHRLEDRYRFCEVIVWPVNVQGSSSAEQVANAIRGFNFMIDKKPEVLIVARGGGSIEDLWPFNEEIVVKTVFDSKIPIVSAIGHETDTTLIDYAADLRAPTPTAAIELITPVLADVKLQISENCGKMNLAISRMMKEYRTRLTVYAKCLLSSHFIILSIRQRFDDNIGRFLVAGNNYCQKESMKLQTKKLVNLNSYFVLKKQKFDVANKQLSKQMESFMSWYQNSIKVLSNRLEQSSFKKILEKGFCFVTDKDGQTVETKENFDSIQKNGFTIHFQDGASLITSVSERASS
ncbi:MAG: exodeoxyribonuclease VII large subunit [Holosporales bacterium]|jgi:exodeoxyribonuclease VII large subunit|nr:exodeoxyribonuclease VII large subunit [Holosporales bacterium]